MDGVASSNTTDSLFISPAEFAKLSGLSLATVWRYLAAGRIPKTQPGGRRCRILIPRSALSTVNSTSGSADDANQTAAPSSNCDTDPSINAESRGRKPRWLNRKIKD